jgi:hypothetical protein
MATLRQKIAAERNARTMLEDNGLPEPDEVEYGYTCIRLLWNEPKLAVVIEIDKPPEGYEDPLGTYDIDIDGTSEEAA